MEKLSDSGLLPIILALIAALPGILSLRNQFMRGRVENAADLVETAMRLKDEMQQELDKLRVEVEELRELQRESEIRASLCASLVRLLLSDCKNLIHQLHSLNIVPVVSFEDLERITDEYRAKLRVAGLDD